MLKLPVLTLISLAGLMIPLTKTVNAAVLNSSFETGNFENWSTLGQVTVEDSGFGVTPTHQNYQAVLETLQTETGASSSDLETFLELSTGSLSNLGVFEGSAIKQTITANAGDVLSFSWNFLTDEAPLTDEYNDFALVTFSNQLNVLADTNSPSVVSFSRLLKETGYQSYTIPVTGSFTLGFAVVDFTDSPVNSALLVDNVQLTPAQVQPTPTPTVPEPTSVLSLLMVAGSGLSFSLFRRG